ncbi:alpha/beta fold hydrolase [Streptomyces chiangmaiensis]
MYRDLIPALADRCRIIAPDYLGYGHSDAPAPDQFTYTFESMTTLITDFVATLGLRRYSVYLRDFGAPIGFRIAARHSRQVSAIISQNGNAYLDGINPAVLASLNAPRIRSAGLPGLLGVHQVAVPHRDPRPVPGGPRQLDARPGAPRPAGQRLDPVRHAEGLEQRCACRIPHPCWSGHVLVLVEGTAKSCSSSYVQMGDPVWVLNRSGQRAGVRKALVRPVLVVERLELAQGIQEMTLVSDQRVVQQLSPAGLHPPLHDRVHPRHPDAAEHDLDARVRAGSSVRGRGAGGRGRLR